ncbi:MAG: hypothetical protein JW996_03080 [Candidatus Cloacimonetes bacterium]|nr:hypothetical protein [Candidatus Cloacimonadota bacterium]
MLNEIDKAREYYNKTLEINPENSYATKALEKLDKLGK